MASPRGAIGFIAGLCCSACLFFPLRAWTTDCILEEDELRGYELVDAAGDTTESPFVQIGWENIVRMETQIHGTVAVEGVGPEWSLPFWWQPRTAAFVPLEDAR